MTSTWICLTPEEVRLLANACDVVGEWKYGIWDADELRQTAAIAKRLDGKDRWFAQTDDDDDEE